MADAGKYKISEFIGEGLIKVVSLEFGIQIWVRGDKPTKTNRECIVGHVIKKEDKLLTYRPFGNPGNRMLRICDPCVEHIKSKVSKED